MKKQTSLWSPELQANIDRLRRQGEELLALISRKPGPADFPSFPCSCICKRGKEGNSLEVQK